MIVQTVDLYTFCNAFRNMRPDQFSGPALEALFEHLEEYSEDTGEPYELDVIGICCDFAEYDSAEECALEYGWERPERDTDVDDDGESVQSDDEYFAECNDDAREWLRDRTTVLELDDGGVVIQQF